MRNTRTHIENYTPERGNIYDRWGRLLAGDEDVYEVGVMLEYVTNPDTIARTLEGINGMSYDDIYKVASRNITPRTAFTRSSPTFCLRA
jgi:cell division protein FtsI/penicillin-binding protein 2